MAGEMGATLLDSSSQLCGPCYQVRTRMFGPHKPAKGPKPPDKYKLHDNYAQLSACISCPLCQFVRRELLYSKLENGLYRYPSTETIPESAAISVAILWVRTLSLLASNARERFPNLWLKVGDDKVLVYDDPVKSLQQVNKPKDSYPDLRRRASPLNMKGWIRNCLENHADCSNGTEQFRPTRLLAVSAGSNGTSIQLVVSKDHLYGERSVINHYVTLSYCWGPPGLNATTTKENLEDRCRNIGIETLPKTVRDAVQLTRDLGYHYLWVDALCIIQGDKDDWLRESGTMGLVYRRSICTIAASVGTDCESGLLQRREAAQLPINRLMFAEGRSSDQGFILEPKLDHWYNSVELSTLSTRGWVMQERILASRTIFCTEEGFFWQCAEQASSEVEEKVETKGLTRDQAPRSRFSELAKDWRAPAKDYSFESTGTLTTKKKSILGGFFVGSTIRHVEARPWHNLIYDFTRRNLTQASDRLNAVQGIANEFAEAANDVYVDNAGIWKSDILGGMAWYRQWDVDAESLSIAPSWSWASSSGHITSMYKRSGHVVNLAEINWTNTSTEQLNPRAIAIPQLHISGHICNIRIYRKSEDGIFNAVELSANPPPPSRHAALRSKRTFFIFWRNFGYDRRSGIQSANGMHGGTGWSDGATDVERGHFEIIFDTTSEDPPVGTEYLCLTLVGVGLQAPTPQVFPAGIILAPVDVSRKMYRRIGWCFLWADVPDEKLRKVEVVLV